MSSTRLPGKAMLPIGGKPVVQWVAAAAPAPYIIAWPAEDGVPDMQHSAVIAGDVADVLSRFYYTSLYAREAGRRHEWILRLTADCPMLTRELVELFLLKCASRIVGWPGDYDDEWPVLYTNRPYDPDGYDMELFSVRALQWAHDEATTASDREHVTPWMYRHLSVVRFSVLSRDPQTEDPAEKVSVDTQEDYERVRALMEGRTL